MHGVSFFSAALDLDFKGFHGLRKRRVVVAMISREVQAAEERWLDLFDQTLCFRCIRWRLLGGTSEELGRNGKNGKNWEVVGNSVFIL